MTAQVGHRAGRLLAPATLAVALLVGCSASPSPSLDLADCAHADENNVVTLKAEDLAFSAPCMVVPAGQAFTVHLRNLDSGQHDVAIYDSPDKVNEYLRGDTINFGESIDYSIEALPAGEYYFDCIVHPGDMQGTLFVESES